MNAGEQTIDKRVKIVGGVILLVWLALSLILGANETFVRAPGTLPIPIIIGVLTPIVVFLVALWTAKPFRDFVMSLDLPVAAGIQAWRLGGLGFIALYVYGVLPGIFAWPAGLGDMAIGATAPFVALALRRQPDFAAGAFFRIWNLLGILDLVVAVSLGGLSSVLGLGISGAITTFPMAELPLVIVPTFFVPLFIMLHITSLLQAERLSSAGSVCSLNGPTTKCGPIGAVRGM
jgi:hypothetical protein